MKPFRKTAAGIIKYMLVLLVCIFVLLPFVIMISYSLRTTQNIFSLDHGLIPRQPTLQAYKNAIQSYNFSGSGFGTWSWNSLWVCLIATFIAISFSATMGYAISRFSFKFKKPLWFMIALTQTIPWIIILIPYYMNIAKLGLTNSLGVLMVTYAAVFLPTSAWLFVGFFNNIPIELEEAAKIDGCSQWGIFFRIILPLSVPSISAISLVAFVTGWGDYLFASTMMKRAALWTLPLGLTSFRGEFFIQWAEIMAMSTLVTIPIVILFIYLQRYLVDLMSGGVKG
jgi:multiple sugar transport system permease protein